MSIVRKADPTVVKRASLFSRCRVALVAAAGMLALAACSSITDYSTTRLTDLANKQGATVLRAGAIESFKNAYLTRVIATGLIGDELNARPALGSTSPADLRRIDPNSTTYGDQVYPYSALASARISALQAGAVIRSYAQAPAWLGQMYGYAALVELYYAQDMCDGIPLATVSSAGVQSLGPAVSRESMLGHAVADFDSAGAWAGRANPVDSATENLALLGKARALLEEGQFDQAAAAAAAVTTAFADTLGFDAQTDYNLILFYFQQLDYSISDHEGQNGLDFVSAAQPSGAGPGDSRVADTVLGTDAFGNLYGALKYPAYTTPIILGAGIEARLVEAEAALHRGDVSTWMNLLNELRQTAITPALPPLTADSTTTASPDRRIDVMFRERAFWLFLTGGRQADLRRLVRQYGRSANAVFPTGVYAFAQGESYGTDVVFPPYGEQYNPQYTGCTNHNP